MPPKGDQLPQAVPVVFDSLLIADTVPEETAAPIAAPTIAVAGIATIGDDAVAAI